ncbi:hypothetical protein [Streptomyces hiroshimensis]|uniref:Lasso RiPP family leader peptide-containing protein n=1 Tax=Streptomyces hiroshimensis TaxID=66424 RepID=A0ABQ2YUP0_9ACTN|nr:hypothetical protein [Streptomyces hiroshimensis]GGX93149.1 hypothetical protein GCM10010324_43840 [Streptomyces hiroshimensis]
MESTHVTGRPLPDEPPAAKRPYVEPRIDELGTVEQLTAHDSEGRKGSHGARPRSRR